MRSGILHAEATTPSTASSGRSSRYCGDFYWRVGRTKDTRNFVLGGEVVVPFREYEKMLAEEQREIIEIQQKRISDLEAQLTEMRKSTIPFQGEYDSLGRYEKMGLELGKLVDEKQLAYGDAVTVCQKVLEVHLERYYDSSGGFYRISPALLEHIIRQVRIIDKQCRIFSNPEGDLMGESPYMDIAGYGLLGEGRKK